MLVLTRKCGEEIVIGDSIRICITKVESSRVRVGIEAPRSIAIRRCELPRGLMARRVERTSRAE